MKEKPQINRGATLGVISYQTCLGSSTCVVRGRRSASRRMIQEPLPGQVQELRQRAVPFHGPETSLGLDLSVERGEGRHLHGLGSELSFKPSITK